jgi:hypothetical protein
MQQGFNQFVNIFLTLKKVPFSCPFLPKKVDMDMVLKLPATRKPAPAGLLAVFSHVHGHVDMDAVGGDGSSTFGVFLGFGAENRVFLTYLTIGLVAFLVFNDLECFV